MQRVGPHTKVLRKAKGGRRTSANDETLAEQSADHFWFALTVSPLLLLIVVAAAVVVVVVLVVSYCARSCLCAVSCNTAAVNFTCPRSV